MHRKRKNMGRGMAEGNNEEATKKKPYFARWRKKGKKRKKRRIAIGRTEKEDQYGFAGGYL